MSNSARNADVAALASSMSPTSQPGSESVLSRWEKIGLWALIFVFVVQGLNVVNRSNFLERRFTDLGVYLRAAWAAQNGEDLYTIIDTNGFHYIYPPVFAILMTPLAEPPWDGLDKPHVPFLASVIIWYLFSVACAVWAVHLLASMLEQAGDRTSANSWYDKRRWWARRALPFVACVPPILGTLVHGQVNLLLLLLVAGFISASIRRRSLTAGLCLAGAICLKVFPAFLAIYPIWRRDLRSLVGCAVGMLLLVVVIPTLYWGPERAWEQHRRFAEVLLLPSLGLGQDGTLANELTGGVAADSQSLQAIIHKTMHLDGETRPPAVSAPVKMLALAIGGLMAGVTLLAGRRRSSPASELLFLGALNVVMLAVCPVTHLPYFVLLLPMVMALVEQLWPAHSEDLGPRRWLTRRFSGWNMLMALLAISIVARILPHLPEVQLFRDLGTSMYAALCLWLMSIVVLLRRGRKASGVSQDPVQRLAA